MGDQAEGTSSQCEGSTVGGGGVDGYCVFCLLFVSWAGCSGVLGLGMYSLGSFFGWEQDRPEKTFENIFFSSPVKDHISIVKGQPKTTPK